MMRGGFVQRVLGFGQVAGMLSWSMSRGRDGVSVEDQQISANPLVLGGIEIGLATACAMLRRGVLHEFLQQPSCTDQVVRIINAHVINAMEAEENYDFAELVEDIVRVFALARAGQVLQ